MAKIQKLYKREGKDKKTLVYPATITQAVKDGETGQNLHEYMNDIKPKFKFDATQTDSQLGTVGSIQLSQDGGKTWNPISPEFLNNLRIQGYVATTSALPTGKPVGTIYGVGPTYATEDTDHTNPIYRLYVWGGSSWVDNGQFTSIAAGIVQETGNSETKVMSQKATTKKLTELGSMAFSNNEALNGNLYSETFKDVEGLKTYSCPVKIPKGLPISVSFYASSDIQCVLGVTFDDDTTAQSLASLNTSNEVVSYVATKDVKKVNLYIVTPGTVNEFEINVEVKGALISIGELITNFDRAKATSLMFAELEMSFIAGVCSVKFTKTSSPGYIYSEKGYIVMRNDIVKSMNYTTGFVVVYAHADDILLSQTYDDIPKDAIILEAFYSYKGDYTRAAWVSPFIIRKDNYWPDEYCSYSNPKKMADMTTLTNSVDSIDKWLFGRVYSQTYNNINGSSAYICNSSAKEGDIMQISFSASISIQCVLGVDFSDGTKHYQIALLINDQIFKYKAEKDVVSTSLYFVSEETVSEFTINVKIDGLKDKIEDIGANKTILKPKSVKIFQRVGCIGDSYTAGYLNTSQGILNSSPNNAWPHYMEGLTNNHYDNWGVSGSTAKGWVLGAANLAKVKQQGNKCQAYMIGFMINDRSNASWNSYYTPVGIKSDIGTDNDSYYAYYYKLVQEVVNVNPDAKIFCNTCPKWSENDSYNIAVKDIVAHCKAAGQNVYLLDLASSKYAELYQEETFEKDYINGHYTAIGYEYMAECYMQVISDVINENVSEFQNVAYIPFDEFST